MCVMLLYILCTAALTFATKVPAMTSICAHAVMDDVTSGTLRTAVSFPGYVS